MPEAVTLPGFGVIDGKLYIAGGSGDAGYSDTLYIYDIATNQWITRSKPATGYRTAWQHGLCEDGLRLYLYGGRLPDLTPTNITQIYDPARNTWNYGPNTERAFVQFLRDSVRQGQHRVSWRIGHELCWAN